jgi:hypothetical protein
MFKQAIFCALASSSMLFASGALAQHGPGGGGGPPTGVGGPPSGMPGSGNAGGFGVGGPFGMSNAPMGSPGNMMGVTTRDSARLNSQGPMHASPTGIAHANQNSVLVGTSVVAGPLTGLTVGSTVYDMNGMAVGTVERIVPSSNRFVSNVLVRGSDGRIYPLAPASLSLNGSLWTTTSLRRRG